jgi:hypothetical protein
MVCNTKYKMCAHHVSFLDWKIRLFRFFLNFAPYVEYIIVYMVYTPVCDLWDHISIYFDAPKTLTYCMCINRVYGVAGKESI